MSSRHIRGNLVFKGTVEHTGSGDIAAASLTNASLVLVNKSSGAATGVTLPAPGYTGQAWLIVDAKGDAATNNITITPASGNINGSGTYVINENYGGVLLAWDGTNYTVAAGSSSGASPADLASTASGKGASLVGVQDAGSFTANTTVEAVLAEILQHLKSTQVVVPLPLASFLEVDSNGDVGNSDANGGMLASNTTPILRSGSTECFELFWAASNADIISMGVSLPADLDDTADAYVDLYVQANTTDQAPTFTVNTSWQAGTQVADTATAVTATTLQTITATIDAGDVPAGATFLTVQLVPAAHATSSFLLHGARLRYKGKLLTS